MSEQHFLVQKDLLFLTNSFRFHLGKSRFLFFHPSFACFFKTFVVVKSGLVRKVLNSNANSELNQIDLPFFGRKLKLNGVDFEQRG
jgi:hypothetical protein